MNEYKFYYDIVLTMPMSDYWDRSDREIITLSSHEKNQIVVDDSEKHAIAEEIFAVRKQLSDFVYVKIMDMLANI